MNDGSRLRTLHEAGQAVWLDVVERAFPRRRASFGTVRRAPARGGAGISLVEAAPAALRS